MAARSKLSDDLVARWHLDPGLVYGRRGGRRGAPLRSEDPLLINTPSSWELRPAATTAVRNLFLASDYVQVDVDVACMEGANEAARRAVNALLERSRSRQARCPIFTLYRPPEWEAFKLVDERRHAAGQPNALDAPPVPAVELPRDPAVSVPG